MQAPLIETERTILRPQTRADFEPFATMWADPAVTRFIGGKPFTRGESWIRFLRFAGLWPILGYGYWSIEDRATGAYIGTAGLADFMRGIAEIEAIPEAGWALAPTAQGRGIASEVIAAIVGWADRNVEAPEMCCIIDPGNEASFRIAAKAGFVIEGQADFGGAKTTVLKRGRMAG